MHSLCLLFLGPVAAPAAQQWPGRAGPCFGVECGEEQGPEAESPSSSLTAADGSPRLSLSGPSYRMGAPLSPAHLVCLLLVSKWGLLGTHSVNSVTAGTRLIAAGQQST